VIYQEEYFSYILKLRNYSKTAGNYVYAAPLARRKAILPPVYEQLQNYVSVAGVFRSYIHIVKRLLRIARSAKAFNLVKLHVGV